jgi:hypothetical protein
MAIPREWERLREQAKVENAFLCGAESRVG